MVDAKTWAIMRQAVQNYFVDSIDVYTVVTTLDRYGTSIVTSGFAFSVSGLLSAPTSKEIPILTALKDEGVKVESAMKLTLPYNTAITADHIVVTSGNLAWNVTFTSTPQTFTAALETLIYREEVKPDA